MRKLTEIKQWCSSAAQVEELEAQELYTDSRAVTSGGIFVAIAGHQVNALDYALAAQKKGAVAIITQQDNQPGEELLAKLKIPCFVIPEKKTLAQFADWFYHSPSQHLKLIGVTGTNGKSTTTQIIAQWLDVLGHRCGVIGTLGYGFLPTLTKSANTTLDAVNVQRILHQLQQEQAEYVALEISSIGVEEGRIACCSFTAGAFTNLTRDHLDYHKTMEAYREAKLKFLRQVPTQNLSININDHSGSYYISELSLNKCAPGWGYYVDAKGERMSFSWHNYVSIKKVEYLHSGLRLAIESSEGQGTCQIGLLGDFNVENFSCALTVLLSLGFNLNLLLSHCSKLKPIAGRMEVFKGEGRPYVVVDYAHTPDALEKVLQAVREHHRQGRIICVVGCGGNRDRGKRPLMGIKAAVNADQVIFTSDNPRQEDPQAILDDIASGVSLAQNVSFIIDREQAIIMAFTKATQQDVVLICGKGHEDYQILKDRTISFSDRALAAKLSGLQLDKA